MRVRVRVRRGAARLDVVEVLERVGGPHGERVEDEAVLEALHLAHLVGVGAGLGSG